MHDKAVHAFTVARASIGAGDCKAAISKLQESISFEPSVGAHFSLADCHEGLDLLAAWRDLRAAEGLAARNHDERELVARRRAGALESKLPTFRLVVPRVVSALQGLEVRLDQSTIDADIYGDGVVATMPGTHELTASAPNRKAFKRRFVVAAARGGGEVETVTVVLEEDEAPPPAPASPPAPAREPLVVAPKDDAGRSRRTTALVIGGVGLVGVGVGAVAGVLAAGKYSDIKSRCGGDTSHCDPSFTSSEPSELDTAKRLATVSDIGFIAGGVALAGAAVLWVTAPRMRVAVVPAVGPSQGGLSVFHHW
jgi:hypothetical protein